MASRSKIENFDTLTADVQSRRIQVRKFLRESCEFAKALPPRKKMLFLMRFDSGWSNKDIAVLCKCSVSTVEKKLKEIAKDIDLMRDSMNPDGDGGGE